MEDQINLLLNSYTLEEILEECDVTPEAVLTILINRGTIDLSQFFDFEDEEEFEEYD